MAPILMDTDVLELSYNDLWFRVPNHNHFCTNLTKTNSNHLLLFQTVWIDTSSTESNLSKRHISLWPSNFSYRILSYRYICRKRYAISTAKDQEKTYISNQIHSMEHYLAIRRHIICYRKKKTKMLITCYHLSCLKVENRTYPYILSMSLCM